MHINRIVKQHIRAQKLLKYAKKNHDEPFEEKEKASGHST